MAHKSFTEYLDSKNKLKTSAPVKTVPDYDGPHDSKPQKEKKHKDSGGKGQTGETKPYKGGSDAKDPNKGKNKDGFANDGDKSLVYQPTTDAPQKEGGTKKATWPTTKTQEWVENTKNLSLPEFTKLVREAAVGKLDECACQGSPHSSIKDAVEVCKCAPHHASSLVREMKRAGVLKTFLAEIFKMHESYQYMAALMGKDEYAARRLVRAMNEMVAAPAHEDEEEDELDPSLDMGPGDDEDMGDEDMPMDDEMGDEDMPMDDEMGDEPPPPPHDKIGVPGKKKKKKFPAHQNLMNAMQDSPMMDPAMMGVR